MRGPDVPEVPARAESSSAPPSRPSEAAHARAPRGRPPVQTDRRERPAKHWARLSLLAAFLLGGCGGSDPDLRVPDGTPVVLISIDTLRSDRLPMYGYDRVETPALDALRRDGILYERAYSPVPMTLPAHATMLSGLQPDTHGVRDNMGYHLDAGELPWLPRALRERGYSTGAAVSAFVVRGDTGLGHAFDVYEDRIGQSRWTQLASVQRRGGETLAATQEWLRTVHREPFFLFVHLYEPHRPLEPPEPFASRYDSAYDGEVASADAVVGDLLDELRSLGVYEAALVVLTSDHGEGLGDHGLQEHGPLVYREQIQVPLVVKLPGAARAGETISAPAQLADLAPTVLAALGLDVPAELPGTSLLGLPASAGGEARPIFSETLFPRLHFGWSELASVVRWPYHYIHGPDPELYDLADDPGETRNVLRENRRVYAELRDALEEGYDATYQPPGEAVDAETRSKLAALGYLGGAAPEREGPLPDPKARLHVLDDLGDALERFQQADYEVAVEGFRAVLEEEPGLIDGWLYLGHALVGLGRNQEAFEAYERLIELTGGAPYATLAAATPLLHLGRLEEAADHARTATVQHPMESHELLAKIARERGDLETAEEHAAEAVKHRGARFGPLITQAEVALARGDPERALELAEQARTEAEAAPEDLDRELLRGLHFARGQAHARLGNAGQAERAFIEEIRRFPEELRAYTHLALLYALSGENQEAGDALRRMLQANRTPAAFAEAARTLRVLGDPQSADRLLEEARRRWPEAAELREEAG